MFHFNGKFVFIVALATASLLAVAGAGVAAESTLKERFDFLSSNGNSNCSAKFLDSIQTMAANNRLQGSCCSPMDFDRYGEQIEGLRKYSDFGEIPGDPYDIAAGQAQTLLAANAIELSADEQRAYDHAMEHSEERGPCCCRCWRWQVYGGLAKLLIREHRFTGEQVTEVWNLSSGCGGHG